MKNNMILLADSGSTKTNWVLIDKDVRVDYTGIGLNPFSLTQMAIEDELYQVFRAFGNPQINVIRYYGAGVINHEQSEYLAELLNQVFRVKDIRVESDLTGAYRAMFGNGEGLTCILGTGTATGLYKDGKIINQIPSLGFWLGDEGSGADLGKRLIRCYLRKELSDHLLSDFETAYGLFDRLAVFERMKENNRVNAWFASFVPFLSQHIIEQEIYQLVSEAFNEFAEKSIVPYKLANYKQIGIVGSVAFCFEDILRKTLVKYSDCEVIILKDPIHALVDFHVTNVL
jgi:glucosamine kinase